MQNKDGVPSDAGNGSDLLAVITGLVIVVSLCGSIGWWRGAGPNHFQG